MTDRFRLLAVDNEPQTTHALDGALAGHDYRVRTAPDGESVLAGFRDWQPHLVVADVYSPHMDGVDFCRRIREFVQESSALGVVGFVVKDRLVSDLMPAIHSVLAGKPFVSSSVR